MLAVELGEAFDQFPDGLSVLTAVRDDDGTIVDFLATYANTALERISGMRIDEIVDHRLLDFVPAFREGGPFGAYCNVVQTGESWEQEVEFDGIVGGAAKSSSTATFAVTVTSVPFWARSNRSLNDASIVSVKTNVPASPLARTNASMPRT